MNLLLVEFRTYEKRSRVKRVIKISLRD